MKIIIAPDSFKECLSSLEVSQSIEAGFKEVFPDAQYHKVPVADGGEGTVGALVSATGGTRRCVRVSGPLGDPVDAFFGICGDGQTAVIEMAAASGLSLVPPALRNPLVTGSFGTGELIRHALAEGLHHLIIGIGGSATNDAGAGMLQALGVRLLDSEGRDLPAGGGSLRRLATIDIEGLDPRLRDCEIEVACDVDNPMTGERGASVVFGPQKGATPEMVEILDEGLAHFARLVAENLSREIEWIPGAGAAGGMGGALLAFLNAQLRPGVEIILNAHDLNNLVKDADFVITGEGRIDEQSIYGKVPVGIARIAREHNVPVIAIAGSLARNTQTLLNHGIAALFSVVNEPCNLNQAIAAAAENVRWTARNLAAVVYLARRLSDR